MDDLTGFQRDLLTVIAGLEAPNGLEIKSEMEDYYESTINHGRLYPNLDTLVERGLVEKTKQDERTNAYHVTESGLTLLKERREWESQYVQPTA
ncbi:PadR family transcriptional regulator [Halodesulfurarchaeum sp. HSR-GB]|uniref:PadR family transcriptional regulator n=1 Tax=Halodesulfurarchaeum sp. HSR-GB TaxID=3074077 RepID=UPI0028662460|nr:PadR family transcriptional regulator [Halodesulfurarchaeum sp. HSR-GB]MDR5657097.1 PadR family transcriptional regulator [Halodesulfurarchaeum sp. HSR-GB]